MAGYPGVTWACTLAPLNSTFQENPIDGLFYPQYEAFRCDHAGGVNFCFVDGSVTFVSDEIDPGVLNALSSASRWRNHQRRFVLNERAGSAAPGNVTNWRGTPLPSCRDFDASESDSDQRTPQNHRRRTLICDASGPTIGILYSPSRWPLLAIGRLRTHILSGSISSTMAGTPTARVACSAKSPGQAKLTCWPDQQDGGSRHRMADGSWADLKLNAAQPRICRLPLRRRLPPPAPWRSTRLVRLSASILRAPGGVRLQCSAKCLAPGAAQSTANEESTNRESCQTFHDGKLRGSGPCSTASKPDAGAELIEAGW